MKDTVLYEQLLGLRDPWSVKQVDLSIEDKTEHAADHMNFTGNYADNHVIQLDASVNQSNSGVPLLDGETGQVLSMVTRKGTGPSNLFDELLSVFDKNVTALSAATGMIGLGSVDPIAAIIAGQRQMKALASEIQRSANVGIGYAFSVEHPLADAVMS
jgi:S1-C subfamily serine protease